MDCKPQIKQFADQLRTIKIAEKQQLRQAIFMRRRRQEISTLEDFQQRKKRQLENTFEENNSIKCHICKDYFIHMTITQCGHQFCYQCLFEHLLKKHRCPQCQKQLKGLQFIHCSIIDNIVQKVVATTKKQNEQFRQRELQLTETFASKILNQYEIGQDIDVLDTEHIWCDQALESTYKYVICSFYLDYSSCKLQNLNRQSISSSLESHTFRGIGHYSYYLLFNFIALLITGLWLNEHSLSESFVVALMYLWSRLNQERPLQFMFVIPIKAQYITWFFIFLNIIFGRSIKSNLIGALVGHTYYYFAHIVPKLPHFKGINISINQSNCINRLSEQVKSVYNFYFVNFANYLQLLFINRMRKFRKEQNIVLREEPNEPREANDLLF